MAPPLSNVQQRLVQLASYDEFDLSQLASTTQANLSGLETVLSSNNWLTDPDISQGFTNLFSDLSTNTANPVTNPFSLLIEGSLAALSGGYASNAASTAATAVSDNVQAALSSGDNSAALTDLENGPTTLLYAFLNGYPTTIGSELISPQFGLLTNTANGAATGSLDALQQVSNTLADEFSAVGGGNLTTTPDLVGPGTLDIGVNVETLLNDLAPSGTLTLPVSLDQLLSDAAPAAHSPSRSPSTNYSAPPLPVARSPCRSALTLSSTAPPPAARSPCRSASTTCSTTPPPMGTSPCRSPPTRSSPASSATAGVSASHPSPSTQSSTTSVIPVTSSLSSASSLPPNFRQRPRHRQSHHHPPSIPDSTVLSDVESVLGSSGSQDISLSVSDFQTLLGSAGSQDISIPVSTLESIFPGMLNLDLNIPEVTGSAVPNFDVALSPDLLAVLGSIAPVSSDLPALLGTDPTIEVVPLLSSLVSDLGLPLSITGGSLPADLTGIAAELLAGLVP